MVDCPGLSPPHSQIPSSVYTAEDRQGACLGAMVPHPYPLPWPPSLVTLQKGVYKSPSLLPPTIFQQSHAHWHINF
jgi:hypothetical protein